MLSLGGSTSEVIEFLINKKVSDPTRIIKETVEQWVEQDKTYGASRRAVQRRRLMRQVRLAMDSEKVGDAVRAETILARLDDQEADIEANRTVEDFELEISTRSEDDMKHFIEHGTWPQKEEEGGDNPTPEETDSANTNEEMH